MGYAPKKTRTPWEDRFRTPTIDSLREGVNKQLSPLVEAARDKIMGYPGIVEELAWQGVPWRWTLIYRSPDDASRPWAYLVPEPEKPKISMPFTRELVEHMPLHRLKKHVKDGVLHGRMVDGVYWATWEIASKAQLTDIFELVQQKHRHGPNGAAGAKHAGGGGSNGSNGHAAGSSPARRSR